MEERPYGKTGEKFSILSFGAQRVVDGHGCSGEDALKIMNYALDHGVRYFDTAWIYSEGQSEERVSKVPEGTEKFTPPKDGFCYARNLVQLAASMSIFSIGVAVYPEGHCESPNLEMDMYYTKQKIDAGADFAITQMFFDNRYFNDFLERSDKAGIRIPIIPGIMPITDIGRIRKFSWKCGATVPDHIIQRFDKAGSTTEEARKVGIEVATEQCADLLEYGVHYFHFYTLNQGDVVFQIVSNLGIQNPGQKRLEVQHS